MPFPSPSSQRTFFPPEVVQSSAMDCGPAALKCLLGGYRIPVSYDRLREACQTDVDGTSIDTLEEVAVQLGLRAEQVMIPPDHLVEPAARALPALVVVTTPQGLTHFVVAWRRVGPWVLVMDPAAGRRWMRWEELHRDLYRHAMPVPAAAWREWAASPDFQEVLAGRMRALGVPSADRERLAEEALASEIGAGAGWRRPADLDAAVRMTTDLVEAGGAGRGREATALVEALWREAGETGARQTQARGEAGAAEKPIPDFYYSVAAVPPPAGEPPAEELPAAEGEMVQLRGAVLVRVLGRRAAGGPKASSGEAGEEVEEEPPLPATLAAALAEPGGRPGRELWKLLKEDGLLVPASLTLALALAAGMRVVEALFFRGLLEVGSRFPLPETRLAAVAAFLLFLFALFALEIPIVAGPLRMGRRLEVRLRLRLAEKVTRLADRWFRSRLASDMAERSHSAHRLREVPELGAGLLRFYFESIVTALAIAGVSPAAWPAAMAALASALALPYLIQPVIEDRDLRMRSHGGALSRFYLDAMLGLVPARSHGAEKALAREHEGLLREWASALLRRERAKVATDFVQAGIGYGLAVVIVLLHLRAGGEVSQVLLLTYWALNLQTLGQQILIVGQTYPQHRNIALRLLEPLAAPAEEGRDSGERDSGEGTPVLGTADSEPAGALRRQGPALSFEGVSVVAAGRPLLTDVSFEVPPGSRVAIVGPSGAGKSSLVGVLLGWHRPAIGRVRVDGEVLEASDLSALHRDTAWVDPGVQLWNRSLFENLLYGARAGGQSRIGAAIETATLRELLEGLPEGLQTSLGEGGALVSGGEGQRVRLGRALLRPEARLVILDEPFRGLDRRQRRLLGRRARAWWPKATLLHVTHDVEDTLDDDRVLVVAGGRVVEAGSPRALADREGGSYRRLLEIDQEKGNLFRGSGGREEAGTDLPAWRRLHLVGGRLEEEGAPKDHEDLEREGAA